MPKYINDNAYYDDICNEFASNGYFIESTSFHYVKIALRASANHAYVVILCNNIECNIVAKNNVNYILDKVKKELTISRSMPVNYLTVIVSDRKNYHLIGKDVCLVNTEKGNVINICNSRIFAKEVEIVKEAAKKQNIYNEYYYAKTGCTMVLYKPFMVYMLVILNILLFTKGVNIDKYGRNGSIFTGESYRLLTYMFLHGNVLHLLGNMLALWIVGKNLEKTMGHIRVLILYIVSGLYGGIISYAFTPDAISVGASGSICGLLAALAVSTMFYPSEARRVQLPKILIYSIMIMFSGILNPLTDNWCHLGGFVGGLLFGTIFVLSDRIEDIAYEIANNRKYRKKIVGK